MSVYINKRPYIIINGIDSRTWSDIVVTELPPISKPKIRTQVEEVDGRDGDIITPLGYAAYDKTVKIGLKGGSLCITTSQINYYIGVFNSSGTIIFSDEPNKYYRYAIYEQIDFERLLRYRTAEITFHVQPFKFSTTEATIIKNGSGAGISANVVNSGNIYSRPELLLTGSGNATVDLNSSEILSVDLDSANGAIFIDSENMNAYGAKSAINNVIAYINPVQDGEGDPSPDNERTIHGFTELNITDCGKNFISTTSPITVNAGTQETNLIQKIYLPANVTVTISCKQTPSVLSSQIRNAFRISPPIGGGTVIYGNSNTTIQPVTFTTSIEGEYNISIWSHTLSDNTTYSDYMCEIGSTATTYAPYQANTYNIDISENPQDPDNPQVVYGGYYESKTGLMIIDKQIVDLGSLTWNKLTGQSVFFCDRIPTLKNQGDSICSVYPTSILAYTDVSDKTLTTNKYGISNNDGYVVIKDSSYTDAPTFKTAMNGVQLVYELATPTTVQLAPTQINNLIGLNQVFTDTNGDVAVDYRASGEAHFEQDPIVSFTCTFEDIIKGTLLNRAVTGNYDNIKLNIGLNNLVVNGSGVKQLAIDKYSRWL